MSMFYSFLLCFSMMMPSRNEYADDDEQQHAVAEENDIIICCASLFSLSLLERSALFNLETQREKRFLSL